MTYMVGVPGLRMLLECVGVLWHWKFLYVKVKPKTLCCGAFKG